MQLAEPLWLLLLFFTVVPWLAWRRRPRLAWPGVGGGAEHLRLDRAFPIPPWVWESLGMGCLVLALAQPQTVIGRTRIPGKGVALVIALDRSSSMTRGEVEGSATPGIHLLEAAQRTAEAFILGRPDDLIGLVVFAGQPERRSTPTVDHRHLISAIRAVLPASPAQDGTNLGDAVVSAAYDLSQAEPTRKVLILLTDGRNEPGVAGAMDPLRAASLAHELGITIHTIALGDPGQAQRRADATVQSETEPIEGNDGPDLKLLRAMAERAGGRSFQARDADALAGVFLAIDALERSPIRGEIRTRSRSWSDVACAVALGLLGLACLARTLGPPRLP